MVATLQLICSRPLHACPSQALTELVRVLCLGDTPRTLLFIEVGYACPPRPEFMHRVQTYQRAYEQLSEHLEASGNLAAAREHQRLAQHLPDVEAPDGIADAS